MAKSTTTPIKQSKLADHLRSKIKTSDKQIEKSFEDYVNVLYTTLIRPLEVGGDPDRRSYASSIEFLNSDGNLNGFNNFGGSLWGPIIDVIMREKASHAYNDHHRYSEELFRKASNLESIFNTRQEEIKNRIKQLLLEQGFEVELKVTPDRNHRYHNGIQQYKLQINLTW